MVWFRSRRGGPENTKRVAERLDAFTEQLGSEVDRVPVPPDREEQKKESKKVVEPAGAEEVKKDLGIEEELQAMKLQLMREENQQQYLDLGLKASATPAEVKKAYREEAKKFHPDNQETGDAKKFRQIREAYTFLRRKGLAD